MTRSGRSASMCSLTRSKFAIRPGKRRPRWVSEIWVRRNSDMGTSIRPAKRRNDDGARIIRDETKFKARDSGSCRRPAARRCRSAARRCGRRDARAELLGPMRLGGQAKAEFERALAGQVHDQHAVGGAVVERHRAAAARARPSASSRTPVDQRERLVAVGVQFDLAVGHGRERFPRHPDLELDRGLGRVEAEIGERGVAHVVGGEGEQGEGGQSGEAMPDDVAPAAVAQRRKYTVIASATASAAAMPDSADIRTPSRPSADSVKRLERVFMSVSWRSLALRPRGRNRFNYRHLVAGPGTPVQLVDCQRQQSRLMTVRGVPPDGKVPMSVQMVLLPVFVQVGLTFALLIGMALARRRRWSPARPRAATLRWASRTGRRAPHNSPIATATSSNCRCCSTR